jgi:cell fate regulator YaaT (PSP1 superfamily)
MGCTNCSTGADGLPKGCQNNGACGTGGCNKLSVFDWLANMELPEGQQAFDGVEVQFKNSRKEFFRNTENIPLSIGDIVATETSPGHDIGVVTLIGELVKVQMKKKKVDPYSDDLPKIYRKANQRDIDVWQGVKDREEAIKKRSREIAIRLNLRMKISDVEFQGDGSKAIFYYTAESRVDFRQLIKEFAFEFKTRIEMKQIGFRQEASRLGGIGSCGRELCCSTWLTDFRSVKTSAARYQQLSLNPQKLAGQCGKLKCCLNYELDSYLDAIKSFPKFEDKLVTQKGNAICQKVDIFRKKLWYAYEAESNNWHEMDLDKVLEIVEAQKNKQPVASLEDFKTEIIVETDSVAYGNVVGQDSLTRFDQPKRKKNRNKKRPSNAPQQGEKTDVKGNPLKGKPNQEGKKKPFRKKRPNTNKQNNPANKQKDA